MNDATKNILIGLFVVTAGLLLIFMILFLHPTVGDDAQQVLVRFANIDKVSVGTRVTYGGKPVGEVIEIRDIEDPKDARKPGKGGFVYLYELVLGVDSRVHIYNTDEISSKTSGLLGEKTVEITPLPAKPGEQVRSISDQIIYANESGSVEETLKEFKELSDKIEETLDSLKFAIDELNRQKIWEKISHTAQNLSDITTALNKPEQWTDIMDNLLAATSGANTVMEEFTGIARHLDDSIEPIKATLNQSLNDLNFITGHMAAGQGALGSLLIRDDIYLGTSALLSKAETVLDDINHYGLLFQNDKRWQRLRARRANLITRLSCPIEFQNYFNDELNQISTSLGRISLAMQDAEYQNCCESFIDDENFRIVFAELLRRVSGMEDSLKMFNQQVADRDSFDCPVYVE